ncbi:MAG: M56 family metallopeptidase, partial [Duncaniella sp.]|nr:M56 family metallopeptidase [Duncaniella sp.]
VGLAAEVLAPLAPQGKPIWGTILIWTYMAGMAAVAVLTAITWLRLVRIIRSGRKISCGGYTLVIASDDRLAPLSWMRYVVISRADYENDCSAVIAHELEHVASCHSLDLLVAQAVCIINWFNPASWLMRDELMLVHEYQADMAVIDKGYNPQEYQLLLIKKAVGAKFPSLANSLNHSKLKKRITMMYKQKSGAGRRLKALALVPTLVSALALAGIPAVRAAVAAIGDSDVTVSKVNENLLSGQIVSVKRFKVADINNDGRETGVVINADGLGDKLTVSGGTFTTNGKTYRAKSLQCDMSDGKAVIKVVFPFSDQYVNPSMTLTVNGEEIPFNLESFFDNSRAVVVGRNDEQADQARSVVVLNGKSSSLPDSMAIYLDGVKVDRVKLMEMPSDKIASVTIDKQNNAIRITSR